jgi:hypothetical protein
MTGDSEEVAKFTIGYTNIGGVYIPVYLPGNFSMWNLNFF